MSLNENLGQVVQNIHDSTFNQFRTQFPFLHADALDKLVQAVVSTAREEFQACEQAMEQSKASFSFFRLSAELRNRIYEEVLFNDTTKPRHNSRNSHPPSVITANAMPLKHTFSWPALLQVNRQFREEATPMFLGQSVFTADFNIRHEPYITEEKRQVNSWLAMIGPERVKLIKKLVIRFGRESPLSLEKLNVRFDGTESFSKQAFIKRFLKGADQVSNGTLEMHCWVHYNSYLELRDNGSWRKAVVRAEDRKETRICYY